jgi:hypothetical protein
MRTDVNEIELSIGDTVLIPGFMQYTWIVIGFRESEAVLYRSQGKTKYKYQCQCDRLVKIRTMR